MCAVSAISDYGRSIAPDDWNLSKWRYYKSLLEAAKQFDEGTQQPDCPDPVKLDFVPAILKHIELLEQIKLDIDGEITKLKPYLAPEAPAMPHHIEPFPATYLLDPLFPAMPHHIEPFPALPPLHINPLPAIRYNEAPPPVHFDTITNQSVIGPLLCADCGGTHYTRRCPRCETIQSPSSK